MLIGLGPMCHVGLEFKVHILKLEIGSYDIVT